MALRPDRNAAMAWTGSRHAGGDRHAVDIEPQRQRQPVGQRVTERQQITPGFAPAFAGGQQQRRQRDRLLAFAGVGRQQLAEVRGDEAGVGIAGDKARVRQAAQEQALVRRDTERDGVVQSGDQLAPRLVAVAAVRDQPARSSGRRTA